MYWVDYVGIVQWPWLPDYYEQSSTRQHRNQVLPGRVNNTNVIVFSSEPQLIKANTRNIFKAFIKFRFRYCWRDMNDSFLSKIRPQNLVCSTTGIAVPLSNNTGSGWVLQRRQKYVQTVLVCENLNLFKSIRSCNLFSEHWRCRSISNPRNIGQLNKNPLH